MSFIEDARWFTVAPAAGESGQPPKPGHVTLVGAGPGDPELLTLRAVKALRGARLVLYDHLVGKEVLRYVAEDADLIYVGKQSSHHTLPQESIIDLMVRLARSGRSLVRLKGGDGFIFGRGGEEVQALAEAGIAFDVVPGITAAQGAGACAGIPLTHRDHSATLVFATGHLKDDTVDLDWDALTRPNQTVVIYMGLGALDIICQQLIAHGLPAHTPAAVIHGATTPAQCAVYSSIAGLPAAVREAGLKPPALIMIGQVVGVGDARLQAASTPAMSGTQFA